MSALEKLEQAAADVLQIMMRIPELQTSSIAVIGGLALWRYLPQGRNTMDVDFVISDDGAPKSVKGRLLALENTPFSERAQFFFYTDSAGQSTQIDIVPKWQCMFMPEDAVKLGDLRAGTVPYTSVLELILLKLHSCGLRPQQEKGRTDAKDAEKLLATATINGPLRLKDWQKSQVITFIADAVALGSQDEAWWKAGLGLP